MSRFQTVDWCDSVMSPVDWCDFKCSFFFFFEVLYFLFVIINIAHFCFPTHFQHFRKFTKIGFRLFFIIRNSLTFEVALLNKDELGTIRLDCFLLHALKWPNITIKTHTKETWIFFNSACNVWAFCWIRDVERMFRNAADVLSKMWDGINSYQFWETVAAESEHVVGMLPLKLLTKSISIITQRTPFISIPYCFQLKETNVRRQ